MKRKKKKFFINFKINENITKIFKDLLIFYICHLILSGKLTMKIKEIYGGKRMK